MRVRAWVCVCVRACVCVSEKTRLFTVLPLENCDKIALYHLVLQFIFFERSLQSRASLLSGAMACTYGHGF